MHKFYQWLNSHLIQESAIEQLMEKIGITDPFNEFFIRKYKIKSLPNISNDEQFAQFLAPKVTELVADIMGFGEKGVMSSYADIDWNRLWTRIDNMHGEWEEVAHYYNARQVDNAKAAALAIINKTKHDTWSAWTNYIRQNPLYVASPAFQYTILHGVSHMSGKAQIQGFPILNEAKVAEVYEMIRNNPKQQINIKRVFRGEKPGEKTSNGEVTKLTWERIPEKGTEINEENYEQVVDELMNKTIGTNWCVQHLGNARNYTRGAKEFWMGRTSTGAPAVLITIDKNGKINEIGGRERRQMVGVDYIIPTKNFLKDKGFDLSQSTGYGENSITRFIQQTQNIDSLEIINKWINSNPTLPAKIPTIYTEENRLDDIVGVKTDWELLLGAITKIPTLYASYKATQQGLLWWIAPKFRIVGGMNAIQNYGVTINLAWKKDINWTPQEAQEFEKATGKSLQEFMNFLERMEEFKNYVGENQVTEGESFAVTFPVQSRRGASEITDITLQTKERENCVIVYNIWYDFMTDEIQLPTIAQMFYKIKDYQWDGRGYLDLFIREAVEWVDDYLDENVKRGTQIEVTLEGIPNESKSWFSFIRLDEYVVLHLGVMDDIQDVFRKSPVLMDALKNNKLLTMSSPSTTPSPYTRAYFEIAVESTPHRTENIEAIQKLVSFICPNATYDPAKKTITFPEILSNTDVAEFLERKSPAHYHSRSITDFVSDEQIPTSEMYLELIDNSYNQNTDLTERYIEPKHYPAIYKWAITNDFITADDDMTLHEQIDQLFEDGDIWSDDATPFSELRREIEEYHINAIVDGMYKKVVDYFTSNGFVQGNEWGKWHPVIGFDIFWNFISKNPADFIVPSEQDPDASITSGGFYDIVDDLDDTDLGIDQFSMSDSVWYGDTMRQADFDQLFMQAFSEYV
jgi:hypothetical protein